MTSSKIFLSEINFKKNNGLIPAIAQDHKTKKVLMLAFQNEEALEKSIETGFAHYFSRSRSGLWQKGEESGHTQEIMKLNYDCDSDTILMQVKQKGPACHTGSETCFSGRKIPFVSSKVKEFSQILFDGFAFLKNEKFRELSNTSKVLLEGNISFVKEKIKEEKEEIIGVLNGTHFHKSLEEDTVLESAQFFYWSSLLAILESKSFNSFFNSFFQIKNPIFALHKKANISLCKFLEKDVTELKSKEYTRDFFSK